MINRVILVGRLTRDPALRKTNTGKSVVSFTLAVDRRKSANTDPNQPTADFIPCVAWNQAADLIAQYTHKGSQIGVDGRIQTRNYDDPNNPGKKVYVTEVVCDNFTFLDTRNSENRQTADNNSGYYPDDSMYEEPTVDTPTLNISSDDLPF
ncbi:MAG: single-stranded DNA-binding protein [Erysipelotrichaceae bacterium]|nr:single-stranded DNA-binding protein [Erysipelotrichaceae bacterium]